MQCQIEIPEFKTSLGKASEEITVGRKFLLNCDGEWPDLVMEKLELRVDPADKYKLKLLQFQKNSPGQAQLAVTSYQAGEHVLKAVQLVDPEHSVLLGDLRFTVKSVINPQEPPTEPFGPMGPLKFGLPWWYYLIAVVLLAMLALGVGFRWRRRQQKRRLIEDMKLSDSALTPMAQLSQKLRQVLRSLSAEGAINSVSELNRSYRIYLARRFQIPTLVWSDRLILRDFKKYHRKLYDVAGSSIIKTLRELARAEANPKDLKIQDVEQLLTLVRDGAERLEKYIAVGVGK